MASLVDTTEDDGRRGAEAAQPLALVYVGSAENDFDEAGRVFPLPAPARLVRFGRGTSLESRGDGQRVDLKVPLPWASGAHCELTIHPANEDVCFRLRDLDSRNGTLVGNHRIEGTAELELGQVFEVGRSFWMLRAFHAGDEVVDEEHAAVVPPLRHVRSVLRKVARSEVPMLVIGETGVGKEGIARAVHERSGRSGVFVHVSVSALSPDRIERELGQGTRRVPGVARRARAGTLYLADVGKLDGGGQAALLSALKRLPVEGEQGIRIVAGTDRDLRDLAGRNRFRPELYSRLAGFEVRLPPLRQRPEDIGLLVRQLCDDESRPALRLSTPALRYALGYDWPYNREQLRGALTAAAVLRSTDEVIEAQVLRDVIRGSRGTSLSIEPSRSTSGPVRH